MNKVRKVTWEKWARWSRGVSGLLGHVPKVCPPKNAARKLLPERRWTFIGGRTQTDVWQHQTTHTYIQKRQVSILISIFNHLNEKPCLRAPNHSYRLTSTQNTPATYKHRRANTIRLFACCETLLGAQNCEQVRSLCSHRGVCKCLRKLLSKQTWGQRWLNGAAVWYDCALCFNLCESSWFVSSMTVTRVIKWHLSFIERYLVNLFSFAGQLILFHWLQLLSAGPLSVAEILSLWLNQYIH